MSLYADAVARAIFAFVALLVVSKLSGHLFSVVAGAAIGCFAALIGLDHNVPLGPAAVVLGIWLILYVGFQYWSLLTPKVRDFVQGTPTVLIRKGQVLDKNLRKARLTVEDMMALLRAKNAFKVADVEFGVLEPDGTMSVMLQANVQPTTPKTLNIDAAPTHAPYTLIADGKVIDENLGNSGFDRAWLWAEIRRQGAIDFSDVFLAQVDSDGNLYVDLYDETKWIRPNPYPTKRLLVASMKKMQADLESFALQTENPGAKAMYAEAAAKLRRITDDVGPDLQASD